MYPLMMQFNDERCGQSGKCALSNGIFSKLDATSGAEALQNFQLATV